MRTLPIFVLLLCLAGCDKPVTPAPKLNLVPIAEAIAVQADMIAEDAEAIEATAKRSAEPDAKTIVAKAQSIQRSAEVITDKATEVKAGQKVVNAQVKQIEKQADQIKSLKTGTGKAWQWLALAGGVGLVAAGVILYLGSKVMAGAVAVGSVGAILVGWLVPVVMAVAQWVFIGLAVVAAGIVGWYVYINRKALVQIVTGVDKAKALLDLAQKQALFGDDDAKGIVGGVQSPSTEALVKTLRSKPPEVNDASQT